MKVLITGAAGYIGTMATSHLLELGYEVTAFDSCLYGAESLLAFSSEKFRFVRGDIRDRASLRSAMQGAQAVVHLAAVVGEEACLVDPETARDINVAGTETALATAQECAIERFIFISTCSNYGISSGSASEDSPLNPLTDYAQSKVLAESYCLAKGATILRFGTICGLSPRMRFDLLVNDLARAAACKHPIQIFAPLAWRPFLHVRDAARAIARCLKAPTDRIFNVISENCQKGTLARLIFKYFPDCPVEIVEKSPDARDYRIDANRIHQELQFTPIHTIEGAILEIADAVRGGVFLDPFCARHSARTEKIKEAQWAL